jgi:hypothetical protein
VVAEDAPETAADAPPASAEVVEAADAAETEEMQAPQTPVVSGAQDEFTEILADIDADDELRSLVGAASPGEETVVSPEPAPASPEAQRGEPAEPEVVEEAPAPATPAGPEVSASAPGMDGFYNVSGGDSASGGAVSLGDIDTVEIDGTVSDEPDAQEPVIPEDNNAGEVRIELGADVEIIVPAVGGNAAAPAAIAEATETTDDSRVEEQPAPRKSESRAKPGLPAQPLVSTVATASLAEIYLKQGHHEQALAVYRKLLEQQPGNARFMERIKAIEKMERNA